MAWIRRNVGIYLGDCGQGQSAALLRPSLRRPPPPLALQPCYAAASLAAFRAAAGATAYAAFQVIAVDEAQFFPGGLGGEGDLGRGRGGGVRYWF